MRGGFAGLVATVPMTLVMDAVNRRLFGPAPLPPREVAVRAAEQTGADKHLDRRGRSLLTLGSHLAMGAALGAGYALVGSRVALPRAVGGALYDASAYAANYLGILPALGLLSPFTRSSPARHAMLLASHLVWGTAAAKQFDRLHRTRR
jgi:hypothetical protein